MWQDVEYLIECNYGVSHVARDPADQQAAAGEQAAGDREEADPMQTVEFVLLWVASAVCMHACSLDRSRLLTGLLCRVWSTSQWAGPL